MPRFFVTRNWIRLCLALCYVAHAAHAAPASTSAEILARCRLDPRLRASLEQAGFTPEGVAAAARAPARAPAVGDGLAYWIIASDGGPARQWLLLVRRLQPKSRGRDEQRQIWLSWGPVVSFSSRPEQLEAELIGPVVMPGESPTEPLAAVSGAAPGSGGTPPDGTPARAGQGAAAPLPRRRELISFPSDYLRLGFADKVRLDRRIREARKADPSLTLSHMYSLTRPVKESNIPLAKAEVARLALQPGDERCFAGTSVVTQALLKLGTDTPGLRDIVNSIVDKPSLFQMAKMLAGAVTHTNMGFSSEILKIPGIPGRPEVLYQVPLVISYEKKPMVELSLLVTEPRPPLDLGAGVMGCSAVHPTDRKQVVKLLVVGAVSGAAVEAKP